MSVPARGTALRQIHTVWPRYAAIFAIAAALLHNLERSWLKWGDVLVDSFRDLDIARQVSDGRQLYTEVRYCYGPLAIWINATVFKFFGANTQAAMTCGFLCTLLTCVVLYRFARCFMPRLSAACVTVAFPYLCAFGHLMPNNSFNYMLPYTPVATYGMLTTLTSLYFLTRYVQKSKRRDLFCSTAALFLTALTKIELLTALAAAHVLAQLMQLRSGRVVWRELAAAYLPAAGLAISVYTMLYLRAGPALFSDNLLAMIAPEFRKFSLDTFGLADWRGSLWSMLFCARAMLAVLVAALASVLLERRLTRARQADAPSRIGFFLGLACMMFAGVIFARLPVEHAFRVLPLLAVVRVLMLLWNGVRKPWRTDDVAEAALWLCCFACLGRTLLRVGAFHYGFYLLLPSLVALGIFWFVYLPRKAPAKTWVTRLCGAGVFAGLIVSHVQISDVAFAMTTLPIRTPTAELDVIHSFNGVPTGVCWAETIRLLSKLPPQSRVIAIPQGIGLLFSAGLVNTYGSGEFIEPEITGHYGDAYLLERLKAHPPDLIVRTSGPREVFGLFGEDYAQQTWTWITENYESLPYSIGPDDYMLIFKKKHSPDPF